MWFTKILDLVLNFPKYMDDPPNGLHFVTHLVPNFAKSHMDGPCGLNFITHSFPNLDLLKPLELLVGDEMRYKVQITGTIRVL
ncbi:hypothetical protein Hanom_Chr09g00799101 [Helianthus anomalus]